MAATKSKKLNSKITEATEQAKENPYLQKIIDDKETREHAVAALQSIRSAFERAQEKGWDKDELVADKQIRKEIKQAAEGLKQTKKELKAAAAKPKKKRHPLRKLVALALIGTIVALVVSEDARKALLDALFGAEEEFEYTSNAPTAGASANGAS